MSQRNASGVRGADASTGWGSSRMIAVKVSAVVAREKARFPVAISYTTDPNENWSERKSTVLPLACSGDMYPTVPRTIPGFVGWPTVSAVVTESPETASFARPKSRIFTRPSRVTMMFSGFKSR